MIILRLGTRTTLTSLTVANKCLTLLSLGLKPRLSVDHCLKNTAVFYSSVILLRSFFFDVCEAADDGSVGSQSCRTGISNILQNVGCVIYTLCLCPFKSISGLKRLKTGLGMRVTRLNRIRPQCSMDHAQIIIFLDTSFLTVKRNIPISLPGIE